LTTKAGDVDLRIPKLRKGSFFPSILERRRRIDRALFAVVMEAYVHGVSTRKVYDLVGALGAASGISKSEVSRICAGLDEEMAAFRARGLGYVEFPYLFADATYLKGRVGGQVVSRAVVVVTGVTATGEREVLGCAVGDTETEAFWAEFFRSLRARVSFPRSGGHIGCGDEEADPGRIRRAPVIPPEPIAVLCGHLRGRFRSRCGSRGGTSASAMSVLELDPTEHRAVRVAAMGLVPGLDPLEDGQRQLLPALPVVLVEQLELEGAEEALGHRVVEAVPDAAHGAEQAGAPQPATECPRGVMGAVAGVGHRRAGGRSTPPQGHLQGVEDALGADVVGDGPAHHPAAEVLFPRRCLYYSPYSDA
jgi:hypothetical protein